jgi:hypothetical protein
MILQNTSRRRGTRDAPDIAPPALPTPDQNKVNWRGRTSPHLWSSANNYGKTFSLVLIILKLQSHSVLKPSKKTGWNLVFEDFIGFAETVRRAAWLALTAPKSTTSNFPFMGEQCLLDA